ncbi:MAG: cyclic nucleotide-binding domain-containing protein, partial [Myxococcales bacterium]
MDAGLAREHKDRGASLLLKGKLPAALEEFKKAVALDPQDLVARRKVAEVFARMGRIEDAIAAYQGLAGRYAVSGRILEAIAVGKVILQLDPRHEQTQQALAQFAARREQAEQWSARLPTTMTALIEQERLREIPPPAPEEPSVDVEVRGGPEALFPELPREVMVELLQRLELRSADQGQAIVVEGERGASMFVLVHGAVKVVRNGTPPKVVDEIGEGSLFGEIALLADVPRVASVVASEECLLLEVSRSLLNELSARHPALPAVLSRFYKERLLANLLRSSELFRSLSGAALARLVDRFELRTAERGDELVRQGDTGRGLFVLLRGTCAAYDVPTGEEYPELTEGAVFGEIALLELCPATATVRA